MSDQQHSVDHYAKLDTAGIYRKTYSQARSEVEPDQLSAALATLERDGYVIIPELLSADELSRLREAVAPLLKQTGRNFFEGERTQRVYSLIGKTLACNSLIEHPMVMALLDSLFLPEYLLSQIQAINILPGEQAQPLHFDDSFYHIPRPRPPLGAATIWAVDDFTSDNGSTVLLPGSHQWDDRRPTPADLKQAVPCVMPAGSLLFFLGTLWHGGGANLSKSGRLGVTAQYCQGFCRPQENFSLSIPPQQVVKCSEHIKRMLGYSVFGPFMGMVNGQHPKRVLEPHL